MMVIQIMHGFDEVIGPEVGVDSGGFPVNVAYEGVEGADIDAELTADLIGDYLFTDEKFVHRLSVNHRNVFQKIFDEVKYLVKVARAGSKEARELERVKRIFEKAYREGETAQKNTADGGVQYSISETTDGRSVAVVDNDILSNVDTGVWDKSTKKEVQKAASKELKKFSSGFTINGIEFIGNKDSRDEYTRSKYSEALARKNQTAYLDKMRAAAILDDVIHVATEWTNDNELKHDRDDYVDFVRGKTLIMSGGRTYTAVVLAGITQDGKAIFHDVVGVSPDAFELKKSESSTAVSTRELSNAILEDSDKNTLAQNEPEVKPNSAVDNITDEQNAQELDVPSEVQATEDVTPDIGPVYSMSDPDQQNPAYGDYNVYGEDVALADAPVREDIGPVVENAAAAGDSTAAGPVGQGDIGPVAGKPAGNQRTEKLKAALDDKYQQRRAGIEADVADKDGFISRRAGELYREIRGLTKGVKASDSLGYLLDHGYEWGDIRAALVNVQHTPGSTVNQNSAVESVVRKMLNDEYDARSLDLAELEAE